jgi:hypothetical protein
MNAIPRGMMGVTVGVKLGVIVGIGLGVIVEVKLGVIVGVRLDVTVGVWLGVIVSVRLGTGVKAAVGIGVAAGAQATAKTLNNTKTVIKRSILDIRSFPPAIDRIYHPIRSCQSWFRQFGPLGWGCNTSETDVVVTVGGGVVVTKRHAQVVGNVAPAAAAHHLVLIPGCIRSRRVTGGRRPVVT